MRATHAHQQNPSLPPSLPPPLPTCVTARPSSARTLTAVGLAHTNSRPSPGMWLYTPSSRACSNWRREGGREGGWVGEGEYHRCVVVHAQLQSLQQLKEGMKQGEKVEV